MVRGTTYVPWIVPGDRSYAAPCMVHGSAVDRPFLGATTYDRPEGVMPRN